MAPRIQNTAMVTAPFTPKSSYTPTKGDDVIISADEEVDVVAIATGKIIGQIETIEPAATNLASQVVVRTRFKEIRDGVVQTALTATAGLHAVLRTNGKYSNFNLGGGDTVDMIIGIFTTGGAADAACKVGLF